MKMESLKRRQEELESREFQLRKSLEKFDTFVMVRVFVKVLY
jgi:hypothetical protein